MQAATNLQENDISQMQSTVLMYRREILKKYVTSSKNVPARAKEKIWSIS